MTSRIAHTFINPELNKDLAAYVNAQQVDKGVFENETMPSGPLANQVYLLGKELYEKMYIGNTRNEEVLSSILLDKKTVSGMGRAMLGISYCFYGDEDQYLRHPPDMRLEYSTIRIRTSLSSVGRGLCLFSKAVDKCESVFSWFTGSNPQVEAIDASVTAQTAIINDLRDREEAQIFTTQAVLNAQQQQAEQTVLVQKSADQQEGLINKLEEKSKEVFGAQTLLVRCKVILKEIVDQLEELPTHQERVEKIRERTALIKTLECTIEELERRISILNQDLEEEKKQVELVTAQINQIE